MIQLLIGNWKRRLITGLVCLFAFALGLTAALMVGVGKAPQLADAAKQFPVVGPAAVSLARWHYKLESPESKGPSDVATVRELRPLSSEEIEKLVQDLKDQRQLYLDRMQDVERRRRHLEQYRQELAQERDQLMAIRAEVAKQWDDIQKAREGMDKHVIELQGLEAKNLKQLASSYEAMKPEKAAPIVKALDEATAAKTLHLMRERNAAKIIEQLDKETAAKLTERMALLKQTN